MRCGHFVARFPYSKVNPSYICGGSILAAKDLIMHIAERKKYNISVFTSSSDVSKSVCKSPQLEVYRSGTQLKIMSASLSFGSFFKPLFHRLDLIHVHIDIVPSPIYGYVYKLLKNKPMILTYHGDWDGTYGSTFRRCGISLTNNYLLEDMLTRADLIIAPTEKIIQRSVFLRRYRDKVVVIPNGIDISKYHRTMTPIEAKHVLGIPQGSNVILFVGNLESYKGPSYLLEAFKDVQETFADSLLIFIGAGSQKAELEERARSFNLSNKVLFTGYIDDALKKVYYQASDIFCLPSTASTESFGIVNLEAMSFGLPIVASDVGGIPDVVNDGKNGLLVQPRQPISLANAILEILSNLDLKKQLGEDGLKRVRSFSWDIIAKKTEEAYDLVLNR